MVLLSSILLAGTLGFHRIEAWGWFDSFYMTLITLTTVGYSEVLPLSQSGRVFNSALMLSGVIVVFTSIGILADTLIKLELADYFGRRRRVRMLSGLSNHYIVCGTGRVGRSVVEELFRNDVPVVVIDNSEDRAKWALDREIPTLIADATRDDTLREARIEHARGLVAAISTDAENVYVTLAARSLNPGLRISARASDEQAEDKLKTAGATAVFTPYPFIGHRLAQSLLRPHVLSFLDVASAFSRASGHDLEIGQICVTDSSGVVGQTLEESKIRQRYGVIVLAIQKPSEAMLFNPSGNIQVEDGDYLIAMGEAKDLKRMERDFA
jgi:voltage-gated potassium channel